MTDPVPGDKLHELATKFANDISDRIGCIVPMKERMTALTMADQKGGRVSVAIWNPDTSRAQDIPLTIDHRPMLRLLVKFNCCWDRGNDYLAVDESWVHVRSGSREKDEPLFRYEYKRSPDKKPAAHLHVHAHRDEFVYMLVAGSTGRPQ